MSKYTESPFWDAIKQPQKQKPVKPNPIVIGLTAETIQKILDKEYTGVGMNRFGYVKTTFNPFYPMPKELRAQYPEDLIQYFDAMVTAEVK
jgi:hypothetical protein